MPAVELCRRHSAIYCTFAIFGSKYCGVVVSFVAKSRSLEDENAKFKGILADDMLDNVVPNALSSIGGQFF